MKIINCLSTSFNLLIILICCIIIKFFFFQSHGEYYFPFTSNQEIQLDYSLHSINDGTKYSLGKTKTLFSNFDLYSTSFNIPSEWQHKIELNHSVVLSAVISIDSKLKMKKVGLVQPLTKTIISESKLLSQTNENEYNNTNEQIEIKKSIGYLPEIELEFMKTPISLLEIYRFDKTYPIDLTYINNKFNYTFPVFYMNQFKEINNNYIILNENENNSQTLSKITIKTKENHYFQWFFYIMSKNILEFIYTLNIDKTTIQSIIVFFQDLNNGYGLLISSAIVFLSFIFQFKVIEKDINSWDNIEHYDGVSVKSLILDLILNVIICVYLIDKKNETNFVVTIGYLIGIIDILVKLIGVFKTNQMKKEMKEEERRMYEESNEEIKQYESSAMRSMFAGSVIIIIIYMIICYNMKEYDSFYSYCLEMGLSYVYILSFIKMTPQLFINYKRKSVPQITMNGYIYKIFETFTDDIFTFFISMPLLHKISCYRDDIVFFIFIFQIFLYGNNSNKRKNKND